MRKSVKYTIIVATAISGLMVLYLIFGYVRTPVINGIVLDAETKKPVENAWVTGNLSLKVATIQGDVHIHPSIAPPHQRTNKEGEFTIPRKSFRQPLPPLGFGMSVEGCRVSAETIDDKQGEISLIPSFWKWWTNVTIYVKSTKMTEADYNSYLRSLYDFCLTGRLGIVIPAVEEKCDVWELDYIISKHKNYLKNLGQLDNSDNETYYAGTIQQLGYLYKKRGDYKKALDTFLTGKEFDKKRNVSHRIKEYEVEINELKQILQK